MDEIPFRLQGIPCLIGVSYFFCEQPHRGSAWTCDSSMDYYGYTESDWEILDRKGYSAPWLERKLSASDREEIEKVISKFYLTSSDY